MKRPEIRVEIVCLETGDPVQVIPCLSDAQARRVERGASMRVDPKGFFVRTVREEGENYD
mgnify:CR=1 FL=1